MIEKQYTKMIAEAVAHKSDGINSVTTYQYLALDADNALWKFRVDHNFNHITRRHSFSDAYALREVPNG